MLKGECARHFADHFLTQKETSATHSFALPLLFGTIITYLTLSTLISLQHEIDQSIFFAPAAKNIWKGKHTNQFWHTEYAVHGDTTVRVAFLRGFSQLLFYRDRYRIDKIALKIVSKNCLMNSFYGEIIVIIVSW
mgnify:FL=1